MEQKLFNWDSWDEAGEGAYIFYNPLLVVDIGSHPMGTRFDSALLDFQHGVLEFYRNNEVVSTFDLTLKFEERK